MILQIKMKEIISLYWHLIKDNITMLLGVIGAFLMPVGPLILLMILMILTDTVTGLLKARKLKQEITSKKLGNVVSKIVLYCGGLVVFFILEKYLFAEFVMLFTGIPLFLTKCLAIVFSGIEIVSVNENVKEGFGIDIYQAAKKILFRVKEIKDEFKDAAPDE